uniref:Uncharacterized protein n=1 Tax=Parascaris univalens TaxID=6257 RepID=A0A914ZYQ3_PARUN
MFANKRCCHRKTVHQFINVHSLRTSKTTLIIPPHSGQNTQDVFSSLHKCPRRSCNTVIRPNDIYLCLFVFLLMYLSIDGSLIFSTLPEVHFT